MRVWYASAVGGKPNSKPPATRELVALTKKLARDVGALRFAGNVAYVYNPLEYAWKPHEMYLSKYGGRTGGVLMLGMNPGPWGMAQTGVPFGEVNLVRDWLGIEAPVSHPDPEHPKRPIEGFACKRSEVSGARLWGWAKEQFGKPQAFFDRFFVWNYCPLVFMVKSGANYTPDKLLAAERTELYRLCDEALANVVAIQKPHTVLGVGKFAETQARKVLGDGPGAPRIASILHPSPASPIANRGWAPQAQAQLVELGLL